MSRPGPFAAGVLVAAPIAFAEAASADTLRLGRTDNPDGSRKAAAVLSAREVNGHADGRRPASSPTDPGRWSSRSPSAST